MAKAVTRMLKAPIFWLVVTPIGIFGGWIIERIVALGGYSEPRDAVIDKALLHVWAHLGLYGGILCGAAIIAAGVVLGAFAVKQSERASQRYNTQIDQRLADLLLQVGQIDTRSKWQSEWAKKIERVHFLRAKRRALRQALGNLRDFEKIFIAQSKDQSSIVRPLGFLPGMAARLDEVRAFRQATYRPPGLVSMELAPKEKEAVEAATNKFEMISRAPLRQTFIDSHRSILTVIAQGERLRSKMAADIRQIESEMAKRGSETNG